MSMPPVHSGESFGSLAARVGWFAGSVVVLGAVVVGVALSPVAVNLIDNGDRDWARLSTIGQAYGPVSALLSAVALGVVILLQRRQLRHERLGMIRAMHLEILQTAFDDPVYAQCWGPRMAPRGVDERLFYYANLILTLWLYSYEIGELREGQLRSYVRGYFLAEISREYWRWHGRWRLSAARGRRRRFLLLVDEEFHAAERHGPPVRPIERAAASQPRTARVVTEPLVVGRLTRRRRGTAAMRSGHATGGG